MSHSLTTIALGENVLCYFCQLSLPYPEADFICVFGIRETRFKDCRKMSSRDSSPETNIFKKKLKSKKPKPEQKDLEEAVPAHILRIVQGVDERRKLKDVQEKKRQESLDSMAIFRYLLVVD